MLCKICGSPSTVLFDHKTTVLRQYEIDYFRCGQCGFIQTERPYWLAKAYDSAITSLDIGLVSRNINLSQRLPSLIFSLFDQNGAFLDYGGGYGMLVRIMRDRGFNFFRFDTHCENLFARHFDLGDSALQRFELVTAFELFEHLENPVDELRKMLQLSDSVFFSTELIPPSRLNSAQDWWYFAPETGQHIALYSQRSLQTLAYRFGCHYYTDGHTLHLISRQMLNPLFFRLSIHPRWAWAVQKTTSRKSLLSTDFLSIKNCIHHHENPIRSSDLH